MDIVCEVKYKGDIPSLNEIWAGITHYERTKMKNNYGFIFLDLLKKSGMRSVNKFYLEVEYNSRHDVDNLAIVNKIFADVIKSKWCEDDSNLHYKGIKVEVNKSLPYRTFVFKVYEIKDND